MRAFLLAVPVIACVCASSLEFKTSAIRSLEKLRQKGEASDKKIVAAQTKEVHCNMSGFRQKLEEYREVIQKELTLSVEEKQDLQERLSVGKDLPQDREDNMELGDPLILQFLKPRSPCDGTKASGKSIGEINAMSGVTGSLFQGDMLLSRDQQQKIIAGFESRRYKRQAYNDKMYPGRRWYQGVNYSFDKNIPNETRILFKTAAGLWMNNTCINFHEDENETSRDLLIVIEERGCWSEVGRLGDWQFLSLTQLCDKLQWTTNILEAYQNITSFPEFGCTFSLALMRKCTTPMMYLGAPMKYAIGIVAHEIGHTLGFWHTQSRYDRDDFITVVYENINETYIEEFLKQSNETNNNYGLTYDYGSVMHYGATTGAKQDGDYTMVPYDVMYTETLGSPFISFYDLLMMNKYYNCTDACEGEHTRCHNGGFAHPRNCSVCLCPSGYGGQFCKDRPPGCGDELRARWMWQSIEKYDLESEEADPDGYKRCTFWIRASKGRRVEVRIVELPFAYANNGCEDAGVEIKTHPDKRRTGYRFCSSSYLNTTLVSNASMVPIIMYRREGLDAELTADFYDVGNGYEDYEEGFKGQNAFGGKDEVEDEDEDEVENEDEDLNEEEEHIGTVTKLMYRIFRG